MGPKRLLTPSRDSRTVFPGAFLVEKIPSLLAGALQLDSPGPFFRFCQLLALWLGTSGLGQDRCLRAEPGDETDKRRPPS